MLKDGNTYMKGNFSAYNHIFVKDSKPKCHVSSQFVSYLKGIKDYEVQVTPFTRS